jgi:hypothetical protein
LKILKDVEEGEDLIAMDEVEGIDEMMGGKKGRKNYVANVGETYYEAKELLLEKLEEEEIEWFKYPKSLLEVAKIKVVEEEAIYCSNLTLILIFLNRNRLESSMQGTVWIICSEEDKGWFLLGGIYWKGGERCR